jgi:hypothetical protein
VEGVRVHYQPSFLGNGVLFPVYGCVSGAGE